VIRKNKISDVQTAVLGLRVASGGGGSTQYHFAIKYKRFINLLQAKNLHLTLTNQLLYGILTDFSYLINKNS
jgi:hypothetical protein